MRKIEAYQCDYCKKYGKSKSNIKSHEGICYYNPVTKSCGTCANLIMGSYKVDKCKLCIDVPGDVYDSIPLCLSKNRISSIVDGEKVLNF